MSFISFKEAVDRLTNATNAWTDDLNNKEDFDVMLNRELKAIAKYKSQEFAVAVYLKYNYGASLFGLTDEEWFKEANRVVEFSQFYKYI